MTQSDAPTATETVAARVKELRQRRGFSAQKLAERCAANGGEHLDRSIIANLENGRRSGISIDEVYVLALALDVSPLHLFVPVEDVPVRVGRWTTSSGPVREWVRGTYPLPSQDSRIFRTEVPDPEWSTFETTGRPPTPEEWSSLAQNYGGEIKVDPEPDPEPES